MRIIIAPCERKWYDKVCAKCFPYWEEVVAKLEARGHHLIQVSQLHQTRYAKDFRLDSFGNNLTLAEMGRILREEADMIITIDSFFQHLSHQNGKHGVVIFSKSPPEVFGYPENINLLKDRKYIREKWFRVWKEEPYDKDAFVTADEVVDAVENYGKLKKEAK
jgi:ADP-heptose:LPS heptosyltransferase